MPAKAARRIVSAIFFMCGSFVGLWASRIPDIKAQIGLDDAGFGILRLTIAGGAITAIPLVGLLIDRVGAAPVAKALAVATVASFTAIGFAPDVPLLAAILFLAGFSFGGLDVAMNGWGAEVETRLGRRVMSSFHGLYSLGAAAGAQFGGLVIWLGWTVPLHFAVWGCMMMPMLVLFYRQPWPSEGQASVSVEKAPVFALPKGALILAGCAALIAALGEAAITDWAGLYQIVDLGYPASLAPTAFTVFSIAMVIMRFVGDRLVARHGPVKIARIGGVAAFFGGVLLVSGLSIWAVWIGCFIMGLGYAVLFPLAMSRAANDPDMPRGAAIASVATLGYGAFLLGPPVLGFIGEAFSLRMSFVLVVALTIAVPFLAGSLRVRR